MVFGTGSAKSGEVLEARAFDAARIQGEISSIVTGSGVSYGEDLAPGKHANDLSPDELLNEAFSDVKRVVEHSKGHEILDDLRGAYFPGKYIDIYSKIYRKIIEISGRTEKMSITPSGFFRYGNPNTRDCHSSSGPALAHAVGDAILLCPGWFYLSKSRRIQNLTHEMAHIVGLSNECAAEEIASIAMIVSGYYPHASSYADRCEYPSKSFESLFGGVFVAENSNREFIDDRSDDKQPSTFKLQLAAEQCLRKKKYCSFHTANEAVECSYGFEPDSGPLHDAVTDGSLYTIKNLNVAKDLVSFDLSQYGRNENSKSLSVQCKATDGVPLLLNYFDSLFTPIAHPNVLR